MTETGEKVSRRDQILQALAQMLESNPGERITTASLAQAVGVSEAALYRHFPSKAKMFEGLMIFIEDTIFTRITRITTDFDKIDDRLEKTLSLILGFAEKNPGMCRLLSGDVLAGETERLRARMHQFFERVETQLKQMLREAEVREQKVPTQTVSAISNMLVAYLEGRIRQYVRSEFNLLPTAYWPEQWGMLSHNLLRHKDFSRISV
jgi:TetR/AcrR family transcriptional regulator